MQASVPDIRVSVRVVHAPAYSRPDLFVFAYFIRIENHADETHKLLEREWTITDGDGGVTQVSGIGVVGEQPLLAPGAVYEYSSFATVPSVPGRMEGAYVFQDAWGERRRVSVAPFELTLPDTRVLN